MSAERTTFYTGILNVIPSSQDLGQWLAPLPANNCILARDPLLKTRSPSKGVPLKITTTGTNSYVDIPVNLYKTSSSPTDPTKADVWQGTVYVTTNTPTPTNIKIAVYITDYSGTVLQTNEYTFTVTNQWSQKIFAVTNNVPDPPPFSLTDDGNPNQVRIKLFGPSTSGVQVWLDDLRLHRDETLISIYKSSTTLDGDHPLRDPYNNYENIYFDTRFDYFNIPGNITYSTVTINFAYRPNRTVRRRKKPGRTRKKRTVHVPISGQNKQTILAHNLGKIPIAICYAAGGAYFGGTTIIQSVGTGSFRTAWISADANNLYLNERWYTVFNPLGAFSLTLFCYIFNEPASLITGGPSPPTYNAGEPLLLSTNTGDVFSSLNGQTDIWKGKLTGATVIDGSTTTYINSIVSLFHLNGMYYTYHREDDGPATVSGTDYNTTNWEGWVSDNKGQGWNYIDASTTVPIQRAVMVPGSTTNALGISLNQNYPKYLEVFGDPADPNDEPPSVGFGYTKAIPYKMYTTSKTSSEKIGEIWTLRGTLPAPTGHPYGSGGAGIACSPSGTAVAVGSMIGGERVEKVNIIGNWEKFDNENFTPKTVTVTFSAPEISGGVTATGEPIIDKFQKLVGISMTNRGSGYIEPPIVTITDTDQTPVTGTVTVTAANTRTVAATYDIYGNLVTPEQKYWKVGSATASGTSWLHKRTTTITFSNGATANLTFANGSVTAITITNQGSEVGPSASAPTITATISDTDNGTETLGTAVAVLTSGRCKQPSAAYSSDFGLNWSAATLPTVDYGGLCDVVYASAGGFVAVGHNNLILKSSNGSSWTDVSPSAFNKQVHWQRVIFAKSNYFCCGFNNGRSYIIKSSDGSSWAQVFDIAEVYIHDLTDYITAGKLFAAGGQADPSNPYFSGPNVVYPGESCWLKITGAKPGTSITTVGSGAASGYSNTSTVDSNGEILLGDLASSFTLGTDDATNTYTYSITVPIDSVTTTITHTVRYVKSVSNTVYTSPNSNSGDYTNTTGYPIEVTNKPYRVQRESDRAMDVGRTYITSDGNSWTNIVNGFTHYNHHIISSADYTP